jgi:hypothetical protein
MPIRKKYQALGRGLDALISMDEVKTEGSSSINEVDITQIRPNPDQPRRDFDTDSLQELASSIRQIGIALTDLTYEPDMQLSFFENHEDDENEMQLEVAMVGIRNKYGKNALLKGFNLFDKATGIKRNTMVGGHNG